MFVELHIVQNFAPSCLNRDDTNAPKDCVFGGYRRARISSQCIKRSIRRYFAEHAEALRLDGSLAQRTKLLLDRLAQKLEQHGKKREQSEALLRVAMEGAGLTMEGDKTGVLLFLGDDELDRLEDALLSCWDELAQSADKRVGDTEQETPRKKAKQQKKAKLPKSVLEAFDVLKEGTKAVDVALFGRMVAELPDMNMNVDAACQVAHALSTNQVDMEMDFYTAVDDLQPREETGAGMMGIVEFNSSCFYRYSLLDAAVLVDNLKGDKELAKATALAFVKGAIFAIPTGKQHSMAAQNLPVYVRAVVREDAQPCSLANAFLKPIRPQGEKDLALASIEALEKHDQDLKRMYGGDAIKLELASSTYEGHETVSIHELIEKLAEVLP